MTNQKIAQSFLQRVALLLPLLVISLFLVKCGNITSITYTIPDNYEGFLIIKYDCPEGVIEDRQNERINIKFSSDGTICLLNSYNNVLPPGLSKIEQVKTQSGTTIPWFPDVNEAQGLALVDLQIVQVQDVNGETTSTFSVLWVGEVEHLRMMITNNTYMTKLSRVLEQRFGVPPDGGIISQ